METDPTNPLLVTPGYFAFTFREHGRNSPEQLALYKEEKEANRQFRRAVRIDKAGLALNCNRGVWVCTSKVNISVAHMEKDFFKEEL